MIFSIFPIVLGILIGASLDDGDISRKDFKNLVDPLEKEIIEPIKKVPSKIIKAYREADFSGAEEIVRR